MSAKDEAEKLLAQQMAQKLSNLTGVNFATATPSQDSTSNNIVRWTVGGHSSQVLGLTEKISNQLVSMGIPESAINIYETERNSLETTDPENRTRIEINVQSLSVIGGLKTPTSGAGLFKDIRDHLPRLDTGNIGAESFEALLRIHERGTTSQDTASPAQTSPRPERAR